MCKGCIDSTVDVTLPCLFGNCTTATGVGGGGDVVLDDIKCVVVDGDGWIWVLLCGTSDCVVNVVVVVVVVPVVSSVRS